MDRLVDDTHPAFAELGDDVVVCDRRAHETGFTAVP
jgi:hypothetical protein